MGLDPAREGHAGRRQSAPCDIDQCHRPFDRGLDQRPAHEAAMCDRIFRHEGEAHASDHHALDPVFPLAPESGVNLDLPFATETHDHLAHLAGEPIHIGLLGYIGKPHSVAPFERMTRSDDDDIAFLVERLNPEAGGVPAGGMQNCQVDPSRVDLRRNIFEPPFVDPELHARVLCLEMRKKAGEAKRPDGGHDAQLQRCPVKEPEFRRGKARRVRLIDDSGHMRSNSLAELAQQKAAAVTMKERAAKLFFQLLHSECQRRLRDVTLLGGAREAQSFAHSEEVPRLVHLHTPDHITIADKRCLSIDKRTVVPPSATSSQDRLHDEGGLMKTIECRDLFPGCHFRAEAASESEVLQKAAEHAAREHGITKLTDDLVEKVRGCIRDA
jgi:predicted small metal-binding protein